MINSTTRHVAALWIGAWLILGPSQHCKTTVSLDDQGRLSSHSIHDLMPRVKRRSPCGTRCAKVRSGRQFWSGG